MSLLIPECIKWLAFSRCYVSAFHHVGLKEKKYQMKKETWMRY